MQSQRVTVVKTETLADVEIPFQILRVRYIEQCILPLVVPTGSKEIRETIQHVSGRLHIKTDAQGIATVIRNARGIALRIIGKAIAQPHDKKIFVIVTQDSIPVGFVFQIILAERLGNPRHKHVVQVYQVDAVAEQAVRALPTVTNVRPASTLISI